MRFWTQKMAASLVDCHNLFTAKVLGDLIPGGGPLLWLLWCEICGNPPTAWDTWQSQMSWEYSEKSLKGYFWSTCLWWSSWPALQVNNHLFKVLSSLPRGLTKGDIFRYLGENQHQNLFLLSVGMAIGGTLLISLPLEVTSCERVTAEVTVPEYGRQTASLFPISIF